MNISKIAAAALVAFTISGGVAFADGHGGNMVNTGKLGEDVFLMNQNKMTLYVFDKDEKGVSNCYGECAQKWPPMVGVDGAELAKHFSLIARTDGASQFAYKGQPLYLWVNDKHPGDMTGDGVKGVWHTARP